MDKGSQPRSPGRKGSDRRRTRRNARDQPHARVGQVQRQLLAREHAVHRRVGVRDRALGVDGDDALAQALNKKMVAINLIVNGVLKKIIAIVPKDTH